MGGEFDSPPTFFVNNRGTKFTMSSITFLSVAISAARAAGQLLREHFGQVHEVNEFHAHDIKLELDVQAQELITAHLLGAFPDQAIYGEEGLAGNQASEYHWIVDPIDGTVNFFYGIPHFCISIALRQGEQMIDIEGNEYAMSQIVLEEMTRRANQIQLVVMEFHNTITMRQEFLNFVESISKLLPIVHIHGNNFGQIGQDGFPEVVEITFAAQQYVSDEKTVKFPHHLDSPCNPTEPDIAFSFDI